MYFTGRAILQSTVLEGIASIPPPFLSRMHAHMLLLMHAYTHVDTHTCTQIINMVCSVITHTCILVKYYSPNIPPVPRPLVWGCEEAVMAVVTCFDTSRSSRVPLELGPTLPQASMALTIITAFSAQLFTIRLAFGDELGMVRGRLCVYSTVMT